jgi:hypothetical protein
MTRGIKTMPKITVLLLSALCCSLISACNELVSGTIAEARRGQLHRDLANGDINSSEFSDAMRDIDLKERQIRQQRDNQDS